MENQSKWCTACRTHHDISAFGPCKGKPGGLQRECRASRRERQRVAYASKGVPKKHQKEAVDYVLASAMLLGCSKCGESRLYTVDFYKPDSMRLYEPLRLAFAKIAVQSYLPLCRNCKAIWDNENIPLGPRRVRK